MKLIHYTYRFRLYPNVDQCKRLGQHFGVCRFVYNHFLERRNQLYRENKKGSTYVQDCAELVRLKKELVWLKNANAQTLQCELSNLDTAFNRFFRGVSKFPKFHSLRNDKQSFKVPQAVKVGNGKLIIPKFQEGIRVNLHREIEGKIKFATVSKTRSGEYYVSICVERVIPKLDPLEKEIGVDLGVKDLATCSDGRVFRNIKPYRTLERRLKRLHKKMSRTQKGSKGRERARRKLAKLSQRIENIRNDHLHKVSYTIISENQAVYLEDLNVSGMVKNRCLAKSISDVSFGELVRQIEYKGIWYGRTVVKINRFYPSSKTCNSCGFIKESLSLSERSWVCPRCQVKHDRDLNASKNILAEGKRTVGTTGLAGGETGKSSAKKLVSMKPETM